MSGGERLPSADVAPVARAFRDLLKPYCERIQIAGSLRRGLPTVADVELVAVPKIETREHDDMFGVATFEHFDALDWYLTGLEAEGVVQKRPRADGATHWGPRSKYLMYQGVPFDLFSCVNDWRAKKGTVPVAEPDRFGMILMIRTGPSDYSHRMVTPTDEQARVGQHKNGRPITRPGLMPRRYRQRDGWLTERMSSDANPTRVPTPEESDVYRLFGLEYVEPKDRR